MALDAQLKKELGERIRTLRLRDGRTLRKLADLIPVSDTAWKNWENGKSEPRWEHYEGLARIFEVDMDFIRFGERGPTPDLFGQDGANPLEEVHRKLDEILERLPAREPETADDEIVDPALQPAEPSSPPDEEDPAEQAN